jgi:hypothetical protein
MSGPTIPMNSTDLPKFRTLRRRMSAEDWLNVITNVRKDFLHKQSPKLAKA